MRAFVARFAGLHHVPVDLLQDLDRGGFAELAFVRIVALIVPGEIEDRTILRVRGTGVQLLEQRAERVEHVEVGARVARGFDRLVVPLQEAIGIHHRALFLEHGGRGNEEDFGADRFRIGAFALPERGRLRFVCVEHDHPLQALHGGARHLAVHAGCGRILPDDEVAFDVAVLHRHLRRQRRVIARDLRQIVEAEVVLGRRGFAVVRLEQRHDVLRRVRPPAGRLSHRCHVVRQRLFAAQRRGHR